MLRERDRQRESERKRKAKRKAKFISGKIQEKFIETKKIFTSKYNLSRSGIVKKILRGLWSDH